MNATPTIPVQIVPTNHAHGYNLSIVAGTPSIKTYRWHPRPDHWRTELVLKYDNLEMPFVMPEVYREHSHEDARLFDLNGHLHASVTISRSRQPGQNIDPCVQIYGEIDLGKDRASFQNWHQPKYGRNDMTGQEKNWCFFECDGQLFFTYASHPKHIVCEVGPNNTVLRIFTTESPACSFGNYRGGTQMFPFRGGWLRFCHAVQNNPKAKLYWGYSCMAIVMESKPPFRIREVSKQPILVGNELFTPNCPHWKPRICIPYGAIPNGNGWRVALGINDCESATVDLMESDLNL